jgi:hypothetical protein
MQIQTKYNFDLIFKGTYTLTSASSDGFYESTENSNPDAYTSLSGHGEFRGGAIYTGISKRKGGKIFGLYGEVGIGIAAYSRDVMVWITEYDENSRVSNYYRFSNSFTSISGAMAVGPYLDFGKMCLLATYNSSFSGKSNVGFVKLDGVNLSFVFEM